MPRGSESLLFGVAKILQNKKVKKKFRIIICDV